MYTHMITFNNIGYDIWTSKVIRVHQRSPEIKGGQIWRINPGCIYYYDTPDQYKLRHFDLKSYLRSSEVTQLDR